MTRLALENQNSAEVPDRSARQLRAGAVQAAFELGVQGHAARLYIEDLRQLADALVDTVDLERCRRVPSAPIRLSLPSQSEGNR